MNVHPLGDQAVMAYCDDEEAALRLAAAARAMGWPWLIDVVQAYKAVAVYYDALKLGYEEAASEVRRVESADRPAPPGRLRVIPCCYELGLDLERVARHTGLSVAEVIALHCGAVYAVYAIGFCPGFPYLGYLPERLCGAPRLETPRLKVEAGSVGLTGRQTGIYTEERPGGWNIVGRTPLELVNVGDGYFPLRTGDKVRFERIGVDEFERRRGERLM
ncbi:MAG: allophanate hydrolase subunit 1 [Gemmataceae bacterium]